VTRQELQEPELGFVLVCSGDFDQVAELDGVTLQRNTTIMQGADRCDFRYRFLAEPEVPDAGRD
jgi:hypothetical protein